MFKSMGFTSRNIMPGLVYNTKGSKGMCKNVVLGSYKLDIYIKNKMGQFGSITHKFLICNPSLQLDHILLGLDILEAMEAEIKCDDLQISAKLLDNHNQNMKMELFTVSSKNANAYLTNIDIIKAGQSSGNFSIIIRTILI